MCSRVSLENLYRSEILFRDNARFDDLPIGFYQLYGSKANYCERETRLFESSHVVGIIVLPDHASVVPINNIDPIEKLLDFSDLTVVPSPEPFYKWNPRLKK
ncbi:MAG: hypothetical protein OXH57_10190 [Ekhidna sp.]|nr:hypothetical protein [Ekhidna sp.]